MRPRLIDTGREKPARPERRRSERRARRRGIERLRRTGEEQHLQEDPAQPVAERRQALELPASAHSPNGACDPDAEKVRRAGGPLDQAVYSCTCGYLFSAAVSTTVSCPHCGSGQAW